MKNQDSNRLNKFFQDNKLVNMGTINLKSKTMSYFTSKEGFTCLLGISLNCIQDIQAPAKTIGKSAEQICIKNK